MAPARGDRRGAELLARADPACESVGETRTRVLLVDLGLDVRSQVRIVDDDGQVVARVDFLVAGDGAETVVRRGSTRARCDLLRPGRP